MEIGVFGSQKVQVNSCGEEHKKLKRTTEKKKKKNNFTEKKKSSIENKKKKSSTDKKEELYTLTSLRHPCPSSRPPWDLRCPRKYYMLSA